MVPALSTVDQSFPTDSEDTCNGISEEGKTIVHLLTNKFEKAVQEIKNLIAIKDAKISELERDLITLKKENVDLRDRIDDVEASQRNDTVVMSGDLVPDGSPNEATTEVFAGVIKEHLKIKMAPEDVCDAFRVGRRTLKQGSDRRNILIKLRHSKVKSNLITSCKTVKPKGLYINESLTPQRSAILYALRQAKRRFPGKIDGCGSQDGRTYVWVKTPDEKAKNTKHYINSQNMLENFCNKCLNISASELSVSSVSQ